MSTTTNLDTLKINYLTQAQYDTAKTNNQINANEIYLTPAETIPTKTSDLINDSGFVTTDEKVSPSIVATNTGVGGGILTGSVAGNNAKPVVVNGATIGKVSNDATGETYIALGGVGYITVDSTNYYYGSGSIRLYKGSNDLNNYYYTKIIPGSLTANRTITLPNNDGTVALLDAPYSAKSANTVLAGPSSGSNATPTFRALVSDDIPELLSSATITKWNAILGVS